MSLLANPLVSPLQGSLRAPLSIGGYVQRLVRFDGTNDYLLRGAAPTGLVDGKTGLFFTTIDFQGGDGVGTSIMENALRDFFVDKNAGNKIAIRGDLAGGAQILSLISTTSYVVASGLTNIIASWDLANNLAHLYIDDADDLGSTLKTDGVINYADTNWSTGAAVNASQKVNANMGDTGFTGEYLDITVEANRRKIFDAAGNAVFKGADGSLITGTALNIFFSGDAAVWNAGTSSGTGGDFVMNGSVVDA